MKNIHELTYEEWIYDNEKEQVDYDMLSDIQYREYVDNVTEKLIKAINERDNDEK